LCFQVCLARNEPGKQIAGASVHVQEVQEAKLTVDTRVIEQDAATGSPNGCANCSPVEPPNDHVPIAPSHDYVLCFDEQEFLKKIDRAHFAIRHRLSSSKLFDLPRLLALAQTTQQTRPDDLYYDAGTIEPGQRWTDIPACGFSVTDAIRRIEEADAWIILRRAHLDPDYAPLLDRCMADILEVGGPELARRMKEREALIIVTSPKRVTAFHMDRECGFLLQVRGSKEINLFDQGDRDVVTESEVETFWTPTYRPHLQDRATAYQLAPGDGVHIPINTPHWIRNGDNVSVSVNINFICPETERGHIYRANYLLRRLGLNPTPPFHSPLLDKIKVPLGGASMLARETYRRARSAYRRRGPADVAKPGTTPAREPG
jgi:hypothetical protein